jgi:hypothetical protein
MGPSQEGHGPRNKPWGKRDLMRKDLPAARFASTTVRCTTVDHTWGKRELMRMDQPSARPWFSKKRQAWG